jgi:hypothetical protein
MSNLDSVLPTIFIESVDRLLLDELTVKVFINLCENIYNRELYSLLTPRTFLELEEIVFSNQDATSLVLNIHSLFKMYISVNEQIKLDLHKIIGALVDSLKSSNYSNFVTTKEFLKQVDVSQIPDIDIEEFENGWYSIIILLHMYQTEMKNHVNFIPEETENV